MEPKLAGILKTLGRKYPAPGTALTYRTPHQLLVATILSAQCTDERVNRITPGLFTKYRTVADFARARPPVLEKEIRSAGFYRNKARHLVASAQRIVRHYGGRVPDTMAELVTLAGVSRKTANIILTHIYKKAEGIAVDTHVRRISRRLGLTRHEHPVKIEQDLMELLPRKYWLDFNSRLVRFGREVCRARNPACPVCELRKWCPSCRAG